MYYKNNRFFIISQGVKQIAILSVLFFSSVLKLNLLGNTVAFYLEYPCLPAVVTQFGNSCSRILQALQNSGIHRILISKLTSYSPLKVHL